jgi:hypothetical protein
MSSYSRSGWWISPEGKEYEIVEHFSFVKANPELFGLSEKQVKGWIHRKHRGKALIHAMKQNWVRIRGRRNYTSIELWELNKVTIRSILRFLKHHKFWDSDMIKFSILKSRYVRVISTAELRNLILNYSAGVSKI